MKRTLQTCILLAGVLLAGASQAAAPAAFTVDVTGQGRPLILIPGMASSGEVWQSTVARLCGPQAARQCHVLTLAGFAGAAPIEGDLLAQAEQQLADYIVAKKLGQPAIIGHSLGGFLALKMAIDHPRQTGKLLIVDSLPALGATQLPSITPQQLQAMATQMQSAMRAQDGATYAASQRRTIQAWRGAVPRAWLRCSAVRHTCIGKACVCRSTSAMTPRLNCSSALRAVFIGNLLRRIAGVRAGGPAGSACGSTRCVAGVQGWRRAARRGRRDGSRGGFHLRAHSLR